MASDTESECNNDEEFKRAVKDWVQLHDEITEIRTQINSRNKKKKRLTEFIIAYMQRSNKDCCNLGTSGILQMKKQKTTMTLKKEYVEELLSQVLNNEEKAKESAEYIFDRRITKDKFSLKRSNVQLD
jgi:hypothetical protein